MPRRLVIYKRQDVVSESANLLAEVFENSIKVRGNGNYTPKTNDLILCWGTSEAPNWANRLNGARVLNHWDRLKVSTNKLRTFEVLRPQGIKVPDWTTDINVARQWIAERHVVMGRQILNGSQGDGIVVCKTLEELNAARDVKMYTKYFKGSKEFRVFVFGGVVIDYIQKRRREDYEGPKNPHVKNLASGYVYCHQDVVVPLDIQQQCIRSAQILGLDLAAVDVKWSDTGDFVILELNSQPGCGGGQSTERIVAALDNLLNNQPVVSQIPAVAPVPVVNAPIRPAEAPRNAPVPNVVPQRLEPRVAPAPIVEQNRVPVGVGQREYDLTDLEDVKITENGGKISITGRLGKRRVTFLEISGKVERDLTQMFV